MSKKTDDYLLKKYAIPRMAYNSQTLSALCDILIRLNKNKKLDDTDKKWIRDKDMVRFNKFIENWEKVGTADFYALHESYLFPYKNYMSPRKSHPVSQYVTYSRKPESNYTTTSHASYTSPPESHTPPQVDTVKDNNKSSRNSSNRKNKQSKTSINATDMRKPHMALHYRKAKLTEHIKSNLEQITPSNIPDDISSLFLPKIWDTINESIKKDINELFSAYNYKLWTATSVMAYRIFENVLKVHIVADLKEEPAIDITDAINKLENNKYDFDLLKILYELKENRNSFMHGNTRASTQEAKDSIIRIMSLAMNIHNIKP